MTGETQAVSHEEFERAQFEAIGRFVQAFEDVVEACRRLLALMVPSDGSSQEKLNLILHHHALTASPLFELAGSVAILHVSQRSADELQTATLKAVLKQASTQFEALVSTRNSVLHGTWRIGWRSPIDDPSEKLTVYKFQPVKGELQRNRHLPATISELLAKVNDCSELTALIEYLTACLIMPGGPRIAENFRKEEGRWTRVAEGLAADD